MSSSLKKKSTKMSSTKQKEKYKNIKCKKGN